MNRRQKWVVIWLMALVVILACDALRAEPLTGEQAKQRLEQQMRAAIHGTKRPNDLLAAHSFSLAASMFDAWSSVEIFKECERVGLECREGNWIIGSLVDSNDSELLYVYSGAFTYGFYRLSLALSHREWLGWRLLSRAAVLFNSPFAHIDQGQDNMRSLRRLKQLP